MVCIWIIKMIPISGDDLSKDLVGAWLSPTPKNVCSSIGMMTFPTEWENKTCSKPPSRKSMSQIEYRVTFSESVINKMYDMEYFESD